MRLGSEFVAVQFAQGTQSIVDGAEPARAWVQAGDRAFDLDRVPRYLEWVVVTVHVGESVALWVEDHGRAQGLDLRTGKRIDPVAAYYNGIGFHSDGGLGEVSYNVDLAFDSDVGWISCESRPGYAYREPWRSDLGWAPEGQVFLTVGIGWCREFDDLDFSWELDRERVLAVEGADPAGPLAWEETTASNGGIEITAVFQVPVDDAEIGIAFTPFGEVLDEDGDRHEILEELEPTAWTAVF